MTRAMSHDRVKFVLPEIGYMGSSRSANLYADLLRDCFGLCMDDLRTPGCLTIVCRPAQFARFLILRNDADIPNGFKELRPRLFTPVEAQPDIIDVSKRHNEYQAPIRSASAA